MSGRREWSAARLAAGAVVVAAATAAVVPQHALGLARLLAATVALVTLAAAVVDRLAPHDTDGLGTTTTRSPFDFPRRVRPSTRDVPASLGRIGGELIASHVRADLAPLSPLPARRLAAIVDAALVREGLHREDPAHADALRARLSPATWAAVTARRTGRPPAGERDAPRRTAHAEEIAATVHAVLDEVEHPGHGRAR